MEKKRRRRWRRKRDTKERRRSIFGLLRRHTEREEHSIVLKMFLIKAKVFPIRHQRIQCRRSLCNNGNSIELNSNWAAVFFLVSLIGDGGCGFSWRSAKSLTTTIESTYFFFFLFRVTRQGATFSSPSNFNNIQEQNKRTQSHHLLLLLLSRHETKADNSWKGIIIIVMIMTELCTHSRSSSCNVLYLPPQASFSFIGCRVVGGKWNHGPANA